MRAGRLDRLVEVQVPTTVEDALGTDVETWALLEKAPAERLTQRASEAWKAGGTATQREVVWRVRWSPKLDALLSADGGRYRIVEGGQVYPISGAVEIGRRIGIEITTNPSGQTA